MPNMPPAGPRPCAWCGGKFRPAETDTGRRYKYCSQECRDAAELEIRRRIARRWRKDNREHYLAWVAQWNAENRDKRRVVEARYREKHREQIREYARRWKAAERFRRWLAKQRETSTHEPRRSG